MKNNSFGSDSLMGDVFSVEERISGLGCLIRLSEGKDALVIDFLFDGLLMKSVFLSALNESLLAKNIGEVFKELELFSITEKQIEACAQNLVSKMMRAIVSKHTSKILKEHFTKPPKSYQEFREKIQALDSLFDVFMELQMPKQIDERILGNPPSDWRFGYIKFGYNPTYDFIDIPHNKDVYQEYKNWHSEIFPYGDDGIKRKGFGKNIRYEGKTWTIIGTQWLYAFDGHICDFHPRLGTTALGEDTEFTIHKILSGEGFEDRDLWSVVWSIPAVNKLLIAVYDFTHYFPPRRISYFPEIEEQLHLIAKNPSRSFELARDFVPSPNLSFDFPHIKNRIRELVRKKDISNDFDVHEMIHEERNLVKSGFKTFPPLQNNPIEKIVTEMIENCSAYGQKGIMIEKYPPLFARYGPMCYGESPQGQDLVLWKKPIINEELPLIELFWQFSRCIGVTLIPSPPRYAGGDRIIHGLSALSEPLNHAVSAQVEKNGSLNYENLVYEYAPILPDYTQEKRREFSPMLNLSDIISFRRNPYIWKLD